MVTGELHWTHYTHATLVIGYVRVIVVVQIFIIISLAYGK